YEAFMVPSRFLELREEAGIVLEEHADVRHAVAHHRDALDAHSEGEAGPLLRIDAARLEDDGVDHSAAKDLDPTGVLADVASCTRSVLLPAEGAPHVDLGAGLDEGEIARAKAHGGTRTIEALGELGEDAAEIRHRDALVDEERLELMEHR